MNTSLASQPFTPSGNLDPFGVRALLQRAASAGLVHMPSPQPVRKPYPAVRQRTPYRHHGIMRKDIMELARTGKPFDMDSLKCNRVTFFSNVRRLVKYGWIKIHRPVVRRGAHTEPTQYIITKRGAAMNMETMQ